MISGNYTISGLTGTTGLAVGMGVRGAGIPWNAIVVSVGSTSVTLSVPATATTTSAIPLTFISVSMFSTTQTQYDNVGNVIEVTDPLLNATQTTYDGLNRPIPVLYADYTTTAKAYTPANLVAIETDQVGSVTTHEYDAVGRHIVIYQPDPVTGQLTANSPETQMGYDPVGNMTSLINPLRNEWTYVYDNRNRRIQEMQPAVANAEMSGSPMLLPIIAACYDSVGNIKSKTDPRAISFLATTGSASGPSYTITVDSALGVVQGMGVIGTNIPIGALVQSTPSGMSLSITLTLPTTGTVTGSIIFTWNPYTTTFFYDAANRLLQTMYPAVPVYDEGTVPASAYTAYDKNGNILLVMDENGNTTVNTYDALNRLTSTTTAPKAFITTGNTTIESSTVSSLGSMSGIASGMAVTGVGIAPETTGTVSGSTVILSIPATATQTGVTLNFATVSDNIVEYFAYDPVGNRTQVTDGNGFITNFVYDGLNRLLQTQYDPNTTEQTTVTESYNALNKVSRTEGTGRITQYLYDVLNRIATVIYLSSLVDNLLYARDLVGNVLSVTHPNESGSPRNVSYSYDKLNRQLTEESITTTQTHTYDLAGNRTETTYGGTSRHLYYYYDAINRLSSLTDTGS